jgi:Xaa-Pro aminopeptidase
MVREKLMNVAEFQRTLGESGFDAVVATSQPNVFYTSGAYIMTQVRIPDRLAMTVLPASGDDALLVCNIEESLARQESWIHDVRSYVEFAESPMHLLAEVLKEKGLAQGHIGIEGRRLGAAYYQELSDALPEATLGMCDWLFYHVRSIKTKGEIQRFAEAGRATERAIADAFRQAKVGDTERDLLRAIRENAGLYGATGIVFGILAVGDQSHEAHPPARERPIERGDLVRVDFGASWDGYASDIARMAVVGEASRVQAETYKKVRGVQRGTIEFMKPGVRACDVYNCVVEGYAKVGIEYPGPHCGHGFGFETHETPMLQPYNEEELLPNMLLCIEPVHFNEELGGYQLEDLVLITETGSEILTNQEDTEELFVIG